jgi:hypothetical protein
MDISAILVQLVSGAIGGNVAGAAMKKNSLGTVGNSIAGILGGGLGGQILSALSAGDIAGALATPGLESMVSNIAGGGVGGAVIIAIIGALRTAMAKKTAA